MILSEDDDKLHTASCEGLLLKTMNLETWNLIKDFVDFDRAFPKVDSEDFLKRAAQNWKNLVEETIEEDDYYLALLYFGLKTKGYKLSEFNVLILWLILCFERPWQKNWRFSLSERKGKDIWIKIRKILVELPVDFSSYQYPDLRTLWSYIKKEKFKDHVIETTLIPMLSKLEEPFKAFFGDLLKELKSDHWIAVFKFMDEMSSEGCYRGSDLMPKLRINKDQFDLILKWAEDRDLIKLKKYPQGTVFIIWNEPSERHRKSIDNL